MELLHKGTQYMYILATFVLHLCASFASCATFSLHRLITTNIEVMRVSEVLRMSHQTLKMY